MKNTPTPIMLGEINAKSRKRFLVRSERPPHFLFINVFFIISPLFRICGDA